MNNRPPSRTQLVATHRKLVDEIKRTNVRDKVAMQELAEKAWMAMGLFLEVSRGKDAENFRDLKQLHNQMRSPDEDVAYDIALSLHEFHYSPWSDDGSFDSVKRRVQFVEKFIKTNMGRV